MGGAGATIAAVDTTDYVAVADQFARSVLSGRRAAGELAAAACRRYLDDKKRAKARGLMLDAAAANRSCRFFLILRHSKGRRWAGRRFELSDWQVFLNVNIYGWKKNAAKNGARRFNKAYIEVPRKQGKSTFCAGNCLYGLVGDGEPGADVYCLATKREQAAIVYDEARRMAQKSPDFREIVQFRRDRLLYPAADGKLEPLGRDDKTLDGLNPHFAIIDELHQVKNRDLVEVIDSADGARDNSLLWMITTAGAHRSGVCWDYRKLAEAALNSPGDPAFDHFFAFVACADEADPWDDPATWAKAQPNLGVSCFAEKIAEKAAEAARMPSKRAAFERYYLGRWVEPENRAVPAQLWANGRTLGLEATLKGRRCYAGVDLSTQIDLSALSLVFPLDGGGFAQLAWGFVPADSILERSRSDGVPYDRWAADGELTATDGGFVDFGAILSKIVELGRLYDIVRVGVDPWNAKQLLRDLMEEGIAAVEVRQNISTLSGPCKEFERLLAAGQWLHPGRPVLDWCSSNLVWYRDANDNLRPNKRLSHERIDLMTAGITALAVALDRDNDGVYTGWGVDGFGDEEGADE